MTKEQTVICDQHSDSRLCVVSPGNWLEQVYWVGWIGNTARIWKGKKWKKKRVGIAIRQVQHLEHNWQRASSSLGVIDIHGPTINVTYHQVQGLCGDSIRWSHSFNIDDVFGLWYGVGYAQHTPDMTNKPDEIGCVSLYITDASYEIRDDWLNWAVPKNNYTDQRWRSYKSNPWSDYALSGSWLDIPLKRPARRSINQERRIRVMWDEDGQTMEQIYLYSPEDPGIWIAEKLRPMEREMRARGIDIWYPDDPPRHPEVIRVLKANPHMLLINHCSEIGDGGIFTLILRRSITRLHRWEWYKYKQEFYNYDLPNSYRYATVCAGCASYSSIVVVIFCNIVLQLLQKTMVQKL